MFDEGYAERDASWEGVEILFLAGFMLVTKRKGVGTSAYEICLISVGDGCHAVPDNRIGGCWETMAGFPFKNFLMQGRVTNPSVRRRSQIVAGFNPIRLAQGQVQQNPDFNACAYNEVDGYYEIGENGRMNIRYIHFKFGDLAVKNLARSGNRRERGPG